MKRIIIGMLVLIAVAFAVVYGVGLWLPQNHVAAVRAEFAASPEEIFETIADFRAHPEWRPSVERIEELPARMEGRPGWNSEPPARWPWN